MSYDCSPDAETAVFVILSGNQYYTRDGKFSPYIERARRFFLHETAEQCADSLHLPYQIKEKIWSDFA